MIKIFAKYGTNEKVVVPVPKEHVHTAQLQLKEQFGGSWIWVDKIQPGEVLHFVDNTVYKGYSPAIDRYSERIIKLGSESSPLPSPPEAQSGKVEILIQALQEIATWDEDSSDYDDPGYRAQAALKQYKESL